MLEKVKPQFLYPFVRQFLVDEVCEQIVRQLEKRAWKVPGIEVEFDTYGSGEQKFRMVRNIEGKDFRLWFCRQQQTMSGRHWNDTAAIHELIIPGHDISLFDDGSGPTYLRYVGRYWRRDRKKFLHSAKVNAKLNHEPRLYLAYKGQFGGQVLVHDNDLGRQYDLKDGDERMFQTNEILSEINEWLVKNVLNNILARPEAEASESSVEWLPYDGSKIGPIYTFADWREADRIVTGQKDLSSLDAASRYALNGGYRLVPLDAGNDGTIPEVAYDGFIWCAFGEVNTNMMIDDLPEDIGGHWRSDSKHVIRVLPKFTNNVWVADMAPAQEYKARIWQENPKQDRLTNSQYAEYLRISGRTLIAASKYDGSYKQPIVLINRELDFDEVEIVIGPVLEKA